MEGVGNIYLGGVGWLCKCVLSKCCVSERVSGWLDGMYESSTLGMNSVHVCCSLAQLAPCQAFVGHREEQGTVTNLGEGARAKENSSSATPSWCNHHAWDAV